MQGAKQGGFVDGVAGICVNATHSQVGSIWHTYARIGQAKFRANDLLYVCGPNVKQVQSYVELFLW
jgi:hypothetical protein